MKNVFFIFVSLLSLLGCKNFEDESYKSADKIVAIELPSKEAKYNDPEAVAVDMVKFVEPTLAKTENIGTKIIKNANLRFESSDLEVTYNQIKKSVTKYNAIIQNDEEGKDYQSLYRNITIRIPSKDFDIFIKEISNGVDYFEKKEISSEDVTERYIDIEARLKAKKVLESRYLELLKKANKVSEMLEIETQLSTIREEIEAKEGQLRYMQNRVSMSTITIEFYKTIATSGGVRVSFLSKMGSAITTGLNSISSFFIQLLQNWPFIVIIIPSFYLIRKKWKARNNK